MHRCQRSLGIGILFLIFLTYTYKYSCCWYSSLAESFFFSAKGYNFYCCDSHCIQLGETMCELMQFLHCIVRIILNYLGLLVLQKHMLWHVFPFLQHLFFFFFFFFFVFFCGKWKFPGQGLIWSCSCQPQPQQCQILAASAVCTTVHRQCWILNPLSGARDQTHIFMDTSWVLAEPQQERLTYF